MAEYLILPEVNQILLLTADGLQWANYPNVSYGMRKTADWSASMEVFTFLFLVNVYPQKPKIYIYNRKPQLHCISAHADMSFCYQARD